MSEVLILFYLILHFLQNISNFFDKAHFRNYYPSEFKDLRPVAVLPILTKVFEKIIDSEPHNHLNNNKLLPVLQCGFRQNHSCSTTFLHITDEIISQADKSKITALIILDFSKAFDIIMYYFQFYISLVSEKMLFYYQEVI